MNKSIQSRPRDGKTHIFRSDAHTKILIFFDIFCLIRVAMGDVNFKMVPEASVFRDDAYFDGPGAQKDHFRRKSFFGKYVAKLCSEKYFSGHILFKKTPNIIFGKSGLGATLVLGVGPGKLLPLFTP